MSRISIIDLETTGLDPQMHEIIEIGVVIFDDQTFKVIDQLDLRVKPAHPERGDAGAYKVNGYNKKDWNNCMDIRLALSLVKARTEGTMFCAHNMIFDWGFLEEASKQTGIPFDFDRHKIDLFTLAWAKIPHAKLQSWSLKTICTYLGIPPEPAIHRALNGALAEFEVYKKLMQHV